MHSLHRDVNTSDATSVGQSKSMRFPVAAAVLAVRLLASSKMDMIVVVLHQGQYGGVVSIYKVVDIESEPLL